jgi:hypothetical protein
MMRVSPIVLILLCGCYVNVPLTMTPEPGSRVHVALTDQGSVDLAQYLGPRVAGVDGRLVQSSDSAVSISVTQVVMQSGDEQLWKGESVAIPRNAIATVQGRKRSFGRSGIIGGALAAAALIIGTRAGGGSSGGGKKGGPPPGGREVRRRITLSRAPTSRGRSRASIRDSSRAGR